MKFAWESVENVWEEAMVLARENANETGAQDAGEFSPDKARYQKLDELGALVVYTARKDEQLVGYMAAHVYRHLHFPKSVVALQDTLFMHRLHRGIGSVRFISWIDQALKELGVDTVIRQVNEAQDYSRTLERMGYTCVERGYVRRL